MNLTTVEGMRSEIFVPVTPKPVFTELKKPLSECKVAFITLAASIKKTRRRSIRPGISRTASSPSTRHRRT